MDATLFGLMYQAPIFQVAFVGLWQEADRVDFEISTCLALNSGPSDEKLNVAEGLLPDSRWELIEGDSWHTLAGEDYNERRWLTKEDRTGKHPAPASALIGTISMCR